MRELENIAVVIDADNTQFSKMEDALREVSTRGRIVVKRAYGNWKKDALKKWENVIKDLAINAMQQFDYTSGKNATDMALTIDTIDLLYRNIYDGFVIVSSDSDYTPLAIRLHESGVRVIGIGEKKTPEPFRNSCDEFIFMENLGIDESCPDAQPGQNGKKHCNFDINVVHRLLKQAYEAYQDDNGYVHIGSAGSFIKRTKSDFDARNYGFKSLPKLIEAYPDRYEILKNYAKAGGSSIVYKCLK